MPTRARTCWIFLRPREPVYSYCAYTYAYEKERQRKNEQRGEKRRGREREGKSKRQRERDGGSVHAATTRPGNSGKYGGTAVPSIMSSSSRYLRPARQFFFIFFRVHSSLSTLRVHAFVLPDRRRGEEQSDVRAWRRPRGPGDRAWLVRQICTFIRLPTYNRA